MKYSFSIEKINDKENLLLKTCKSMKRTGKHSLTCQYIKNNNNTSKNHHEQHTIYHRKKFKGNGCVLELGSDNTQSLLCILLDLATVHESHDCNCLHNNQVYVCSLYW